MTHSRIPLGPIAPAPSPRRWPGWCAATVSTALLFGCGGGDNDNASALLLPPPPAPAPAPASPPTAAVPLACDDSLKTAFAPDANTKVTLVKAFKAGDPLVLPGAPVAPSPKTAAKDLCLVKLVVGPGNPGPADAPSTSAGIGIEVWLPSAEAWNGRVHVFGGGGWAGGTAISSLTAIGATNAQGTASDEGAVSAQTDTGHTGGDGSFTMNPDGSINTASWTDFASRGMHEMAEKTKALAQGFYLQAPKYSYWDGCSTGGRQGMAEAQLYPKDFDGIVAGAPAFNWTKFISSELNPQIVMQRDLGGVPLTRDQLTLASSAAVSACDAQLNGQHDGYLSDPSQCHYDPAKDAAVLCTADGGTNATAACLSKTQALAVNKIWFGQSADGSAPDPAADNGFSPFLAPNQLWYGLSRGAQLTSLAGSTSMGAPSPFGVASDQVALSLQDPTLAAPSFENATGSGASRWMSLSYLDMANAFSQGVALQKYFGNINTDNPDLSAFRDGGGKLLSYHGLADVLIPSQGTLNYYTRASTAMGGYAATQNFYRLFLVPGMGHCSGIGSANGTAGVSPAANPPLPGTNQFYNVMTDWVEKGVAPETIPVSTKDGSVSRALCMYPRKQTYVSGDRASAASYACK